MPLRDPRWDNLTNADWEEFARAWIAELSGLKPPPLPELPVLFPEDPETTASDFVTPMNFTASAESQWRFIETVFRLGNDETMGHLAAGPVEHLLSKHGEAYIERFEALACGHSFCEDVVWMLQTFDDRRCVGTYLLRSQRRLARPDYCV
jgi:hypothetical protein